LKPADLQGTQAETGRGLRFPNFGMSSQARTAAVSWSIVLFGLVGAQALYALTLIVAAHRLLPVEYGQYLACYGFVTLLIVIPSYGLDTWLLAESGHTRERATQTWRSALGFKVRLLLPWTAAMVGLTLLLPADKFPPAIMLPAAIGAACDSIATLSYSALRGIDRHQRVSATQLAGAAMTLITVLLLPLGPGRVALFAMGRAAVSGVVAVAAGLLARRALAGKAELIPFRQLERMARPFVLADLAVAVYLKADLTLVTLFLGATAAGVYGPALNLINISFLVPSALYLVVLPLLSRAYGAARLNFIRLGRMQLAAQTLAGAAISLVFFCLAQPIVNIALGPAYAPSVVILRILSPIPFIKSINFGLAALITAGRLQPQRMRVQVFCAVFGVAADLAVLSRWGVPAVAMVYVISEILLLLGYSLIVYRRRVLKAPATNGPSA
jgi:O-antigen/teichoic acid export membrane protein